MIRAEQKSGDFRRDRERWAGPIDISETELGFLGATASAYIQQQTKGHYPAPLAALEVMLGGGRRRPRNRLPDGGRGVRQAVRLADQSRAAQRVLPHRSQQEGSRRRQAASSRSKIASAGVVGAGVMGQGIAAANVKRGIPVAILDSSQEALARGVQGVLNEVAYNKQIKGPDVKRAVELAPLVNGTLSDVELCHSDIDRRSDHRKAATPSSSCSPGSSR